MAAFLNSQLDFIYFFYGLAFILLGGVSFAIGRRRNLPPWFALAAFGLVHGLSEWLDLLALIFTDNPGFALTRLAVRALSFILLMEFARLEAARLGAKVPRRWVYAPLVTAIVLAGWFGGLSAADAVTRYLIGFSAAAASAGVFLLQAKRLTGSERHFALAAAIGFALYAMAAGAVVSWAPFWPADTINSEAFSSVSGVPIQLVRGLLACWIAAAVWGLCSETIIQEVSATRYAESLRRLFAYTMAWMGIILVLGWGLTEYLGGIYKVSVEREAKGDLELLASHLAGETRIVDGMVQALAGAPGIRPLLLGQTGQDRGQAQTILALDVRASDARSGYIVDRAGGVLAASNGPDQNLANEPNARAKALVERALTGDPSYQFAVRAETGDAEYAAAYPIFGDTGVIGAAVLIKSLDTFEADLKQFDRTFFIVDEQGTIVLSNRPGAKLRPLWPTELDPFGTSTQAHAIGSSPVLKQEIYAASWTNIDGTRSFVLRRAIDNADWSLVLLTPARGIFASRALGLVITLMATAVVLVHLVGRERRIHDNIELERRLALEELAESLSLQATTDPLTGLCNRLKFNRELALEMLRAQRYSAPLSLILYDVDKFKQVNDGYGHQVGDVVLMELSRVVAAVIRSSDVLARWGGEEFAVLAPQTGDDRAWGLAQNLRRAINTADFGEAGCVTCSFGVAQFAPGETAEGFIARADAALYRAKINGRDRIEMAPRPAIPARGLDQVA